MLKSVSWHFKSTKYSTHKKNSRCSACKDTIKEMLKRIFGSIKEKIEPNVPVSLEKYRGEAYYKKLKAILGRLESYRGKKAKSFIRSAKLQRCDIFVPKPAPGFVVELDEIQHFTMPRYRALAAYPVSLALGYDRKKYMAKCKKLNQKDPNPHYRDEQRAWYDTLRDFLPLIGGLKPTVRIIMNDFEWCSLDPDKPEDVLKFKAFVFGKAKK